MKKSLFILTLIILNSNSLFAQHDTSFVKATFDGDINKYFGSKLDFPRNLASQNIQGKTVISFQIDKKGELNSIIIENFPHIELAKEAVNILSSTKGKWSPTLINNKPTDFVYKIIINYHSQISHSSSWRDESIILKDRSLRKIKKGQYEKALDLINDAIEVKPYQWENYKIRAEIYSALNNTIEAEQDVNRAIKYEQEIMLNLDIVSYAVIRTVSRTSRSMRRM